jgi:hypothetical protein
MDVYRMLKRGIHSSFTLDLCRSCSSLDSELFLVVSSKILTKSGEYYYYVGHDGMAVEPLHGHLREAYRMIRNWRLVWNNHFQEEHPSSYHSNFLASCYVNHHRYNLLYLCQNDVIFGEWNCCLGHVSTLWYHLQVLLLVSLSLNLPNPSGCTRPWGLLSLLTEMSTRT